MRVNANSPVQGVTGVNPKIETAPAARLEPDQASLSNAQAAHQALEQTPAVRADKVAQAKALVADPAYPSDSVINGMAEVLAKGLKTNS